MRNMGAEVEICSLKITNIFLEGLFCPKKVKSKTYKND